MGPRDFLISSFGLQFMDCCLIGAEKTRKQGTPGGGFRGVDSFGLPYDFRCQRGSRNLSRLHFDGEGEPLVKILCIFVGAVKVKQCLDHINVFPERCSDQARGGYLLSRA